jgi:hypothetical protein
VSPDLAPWRPLSTEKRRPDMLWRVNEYNTRVRTLRGLIPSQRHSADQGVFVWVAKDGFGRGRTGREAIAEATAFVRATTPTFAPEFDGSVLDFA